MGHSHWAILETVPDEMTTLVAQAGLEPAERAYQARMFTSYITAHQIIWRERQDSNLQLPVLETGTLPN